MVLVGMRDDEGVEFAYADVVQEWNDDILAGILAAVVSCINEKVSSRWCLDEVAIALPDVNCRESPGRVLHFAVTFKCEQSGRA